MSDIHIVRNHQLGLPRARELAQSWVRDAQQRYGMTCHQEAQSPECDCVHFKQAGVHGTLMVAPGQFELKAELGFLLKGFRHKISSTIEARLDALLRESGG